MSKAEINATLHSIAAERIRLDETEAAPERRGVVRTSELILSNGANPRRTEIQLDSSSNNVFAASSRRLPGSGIRIALVGFQDEDNLGLRYLAAAAMHHGHRVDIVTYNDDPTFLCRTVRATAPSLVGFSLIFQYMAPKFARVISALREDGFTGHITIGGHYPSFDPEEILSRIPHLDSVVRFEGEGTLVELLRRLQSGKSWQDLDGLAWRDSNGKVFVNQVRPPIEDLDALPTPVRDDLNYEGDDIPTASILASRGCPRNCSFCSIRPFYEAQGGPLRRLGSPVSVAGEMLDLYLHRGVRVYLFQDDDFLATGRRARTWALELAQPVYDSPMRGRVAMKVSCRSDEVHEETMRHLRDLGGLTHIYLGVESGDEDGLRHSNKRLRVDAHLRAGEVLRKLNLSFDFGFMLLEPYSTLEQVRANTAFLERFVGDGWTVATFCRTLPYAGTPLKSQLEREGRLLGTPFDPDYRFLDPRLDVFYDWMLSTFRRRNFTDGGLCHILRVLQFELHLCTANSRRSNPGEQAYGRYLTSVCNRVALYSLRQALDYVESRSVKELENDTSFLFGLMEHEIHEEEKLIEEVMDFYRSLRQYVHSDRKVFPGGFERTWTLAEAVSSGN